MNEPENTEVPAPTPHAASESAADVDRDEWSEEFSAEELAELFAEDDALTADAPTVPVADVTVAPEPDVEVIGPLDEDDQESESDEGERLQKLLARAGVGSRRAAEEMIRQGRVSVNGVAVSDLGRRARVDRDIIVLDGKRLRIPRPGSTVVLLNKPRGCVSTRMDPEGRATVMQVLPKKWAHLHPIGRLDFDTSGLLLLTDDGELTNLLTHPSHGVEKRYLVRVRGVVAIGTLDRLQKGVALEDGVTAPCRVRVRAQTPSNALLEIVLREGRNRQIRRMMEAVGHPVSALRRVRVGPLDLGGLLPGSYRELLPGEVHLLKKAASTSKSPLKTARPYAYKPRPAKTQPKSKTGARAVAPPDDNGGEPRTRRSPRAASTSSPSTSSAPITSPAARAPQTQRAAKRVAEAAVDSPAPRPRKRPPWEAPEPKPAPRRAARTETREDSGAAAARPASRPGTGAVRPSAPRSSPARREAPRPGAPRPTAPAPRTARPADSAASSAPRTPRSPASSASRSTPTRPAASRPAASRPAAPSSARPAEGGARKTPAAGAKPTGGAKPRSGSTPKLAQRIEKRWK
jgi:23S rRNA pseudouridine2605 synthase